MTLGLLDLQKRFRELGRIRLGERGQKGAPKKLSEFRLTSASSELLAVASHVYGGAVREWTGAPTEGKQYELLTGADRLDVLIPPGEPLSQSWELWSGGGCQRRCNGVAQETGEECVCPADIEERMELAKTGKACKATTRLSVMLPRIPDIGVWRVETHGLNAAVELPGTVEILKAALNTGELIPAQLRLDQRTSKKDGQTRHFVVPVLELPTVTTAALMAGGVKAIEAAPVAAISSGGELPRDIAEANDGLPKATRPDPSVSERISGEGVLEERKAAAARSLPPLPNEIDTAFVMPANIERAITRLIAQTGLDLNTVIEEVTGASSITSVEQANKVVAELQKAKSA